ncbi:MAG: glycosyltransferase [Nitrospirae bacterium]|uniref:glycosyltransferase n=1 Tax=Candidatus Magnetobacterium casense TaxID=1455061 RepID=UPI00058CCE4C|nr:glycosyltransferase [Candidatus Magnetobacterium casensis]MBF0336642.1 glycosyltransferase [Nitrospirota bacterium]
MEAKKVSVLMPTYNNDAFVAEAIEGCLSQTYKNLEICISDDCSTDRTVDVVMAYKERYPDIIKLFVQPYNMGVYSIAINVNKSLDMCQGQYIAICEGDDIMLPERLQHQVGFLENNPHCIAVTHNCEVFDSGMGKIDNDFFGYLNTADRSTSYLIKFGNHVHTPTVMFRNLRDTPFRTNPSIKRMLDWYLFIEMSMHGTIAHQDLTLTRYRRHGNNISKTNLTEDILLTLSLVEANYPRFIREVQEARAYMYLHQFRKNKISAYGKGLFSYNPLLLTYSLATAVADKVVKRWHH